MKTRLLLMLMGLAMAGSARAQIGEGGIPLSKQTDLKDQYVPVSSYALPNWDSALAKRERAEAGGMSQPYLLALFASSNVSFPASGSFTKSADGNRTIWRAQIKIEGAKAIGLYYDKFQLPKGVQYFISNANGNQILGAYTAANNAPSKAFANEAVQGSIINLEMDIDPSVNLNDIEFHINRSAVYFRGVEYLAKFSVDDLHEIDAIDTILNGKSSVCMINAICPEGANYPNQRKATLETLIPEGAGVATCSATMVNNTANTPSNCKRYLLTATHCDATNSTTSSHFDQYVMRFNFEKATCNSTAIPQSNTLVGADFVARADYNDSYPIDSIKGDFLLLQPRQNIPDSWNVVLAGWNKNPNLPTSVSLPKKFIGFHHPDGDVKKVSSAQTMEASYLSDNYPVNTHWSLELNSGLASTGSSGSGLFDGDGYLIGIASVAGASDELPANCKKNIAGETLTGTSDIIAYSMFAYDWDYTVNGPANNRKLKPWLDPNNSGVTTLHAVKSNCTPVGGSTGITVNNNELANAINIYPNPNTTGKINIQINLSETSDITMELFDVTGKSLKSYLFNKVRSGNYSLDIGNLSNGMYLLKCADGYNSTSKKIMLTK